MNSWNPALSPKPSGHSIQDTSVSSAPKEKGAKFLDKIRTALGNFAGAVYRWGITVTGPLPLSTRGVLFRLAISPLLIPIRLIQSIGPGFSQKFQEYMTKDWNRGIQDFYTDLESPQNQDLRKQVVAENFRYAAYMYRGFYDYNKDGGENGVLLSPHVDENDIPEEHRGTINQIRTKLEEIGFKVDDSGNYYHLETGNMFNLIFDTERQEIITCFMGLGNEANLNIDEEEQAKITKESLKAAGADWFGGIPPSARQAIEIGKMLKETTKDTKLTPVMVGHSHGGGLAQTGAVANGLKGVAFNSRPMGAGTRRYIGQDTIAENSKNITTFSGKGDWLSGTVIVNYLAILFERLTGIPVPRSVGTGYLLPLLPGESKLANHVRIYEEFEKLKDMD